MLLVAGTSMGKRTVVRITSDARSLGLDVGYERCGLVFLALWLSLPMSVQAPSSLTLLISLCYCPKGNVNPLHERRDPMSARAETYNLTASNGRHIRKATKVVFDSGHEVRFTERLSKREALRQAAKLPTQ
jgi:hypothetical protein